MSGGDAFGAFDSTCDPQIDMGTEAGHDAVRPAMVVSVLRAAGPFPIDPLESPQ